MKATDLGGVVGHYIEPIAQKIVRLQTTDQTNCI